MRALARLRRLAVPATILAIAAGCGHRSGGAAIDAPVDAAATPPDAPVDAAPPPDALTWCTPRSGGTVAAPVWASLDGEPVQVTAPAGDARVFVVDRLGKLWIFDRDGTNPRVFLDISPMVESAGPERGLLGLAFAPDYAQSGRFYIDYVRTSAVKAEIGDIVIAEYTVPPATPDAADPASRRQVLVIPHHSFANHNGGMVTFGPDGYLYISVGDGGGSGGTNLSPDAQWTNSLNGKVLRIDPRATATAPYTIPADNPYATTAGASPEIFHLGLRNPWRMAFDRATGALYIADVGGQHYEEVNVVPPGKANLNFGWDDYEGPDGTLCTQRGCDPSGFTAPLVVHQHRDGWCAIMGGQVYRGACFPDLVGRYFYADYCNTSLWSFALPQGTAAPTPAESATGLSTHQTSVGVDGLGELYITVQSGQIRKVQEQ